MATVWFPCEAVVAWVVDKFVIERRFATHANRGFWWGAPLGPDARIAVLKYERCMVAWGIARGKRHVAGRASAQTAWRKARPWASRASRFIWALALAGSLSAGAFADPYSQFTFCAPPVRPACVDDASRPADRCDEDIQIYMTSVFKYRECLEHETERAVREANDVIASQRCRDDKTRCRPNAQSIRGRVLTP